MTSIRIALVAIVLLAVAGAAACGDERDPSTAPPTSATSTSTTSTASTASTTSTDGTVDPRLAGRDTAPLPDGAFLRFQAISRSPDPRTNHRWVLHEDGRLFLAFHSDDTAGAVPFDTPLPKTPTRTLPQATVDELRALLRDAGFLELPALVQEEGEGGMWQVVTARLDGTEHEVVFDRARHPVPDRLQRVATQV